MLGRFLYQPNLFEDSLFVNLDPLSAAVSHHFLLRALAPSASSSSSSSPSPLKHKKDPTTAKVTKSTLSQRPDHHVLWISWEGPFTPRLPDHIEVLHLSPWIPMEEQEVMISRKLGDSTAHPFKILVLSNLATLSMTSSMHDVARLVRVLTSRKSLVDLCIGVVSGNPSRSERDLLRVLSSTLANIFSFSQLNTPSPRSAQCCSIARRKNGKWLRMREVVRIGREEGLLDVCVAEDGEDEPFDWKKDDDEGDDDDDDEEGFDAQIEVDHDAIETESH